MEANLYITFIGVSVAVIVIPGPSVLLIISSSLQRGPVAGLHVVAGTSAAMLIQLGIAMIGLSSLVTTLVYGLDMVRWAGIACLCYLGIQRWRHAGLAGRFATGSSPPYSSAFVQGFLVALTNPATLLFFVAFFPQFLTETASPGPQLWLMSATFWMLALLFDIVCASLAGRIGQRLQEPRWAVRRDQLSGAILLLAAAALALARL